MFELMDPAFHQAIRDMGYGEIQYVDSGPWYTKADCQRMLEHPDTPAEERMCAQWVLDKMAREEAEEAEQAECEKANAQGGDQNNNEKEEAKTEVGDEEETEKEEVQDGTKNGEERFTEWLYNPQPTSSGEEMKQGS